MKVGVEVNATAAKRARQRLSKGRVLVDSFERADLPENSFDVVTAWDVVEHLPNLQHAINRVSRLLRDGGLFIFETGDYTSSFARYAGLAWYYYSIPDHFVFLAEEVARSLLQRCGFNIIEIWNGPHSRAREMAGIELLISRLKSIAVIAYTLRGRVKWSHRMISLLLGKDGSLSNPYFTDHLTVGASKIPS